MGTRSERLREAQAELEHGPPPITKASEDRLATRPRLGLVTYVCILLAALGAVWALSGLASANPSTLMQGLGMAIFWGLLAWLNEVLRARQRRRREG